MSLWKNNDNPKSAPVWYARHCHFNGKSVENNQINLRFSNTSFETGDCVVYYTSNPIGGLSNEGVYYLRKNGNKYNVCSSRANAKNPLGEVISIAPTSEDSKQLFVKFDNKNTSVDGTEVPAVVAVDKETAKLRVGGLVSPGWYRYYKYTDSSQKSRIHLELLAGVKTMTLTPSGTYSVTCKFFSDTAGENKFDKSSDAPSAGVNKLVFEITTTGPVHKDVNLIFDMYNASSEGKGEAYRHFWNDQNYGSRMRFQWEYEGESISSLPGTQADAHPTYAYITVPVDVDDAQTVTAEVVMKGGNYRYMNVDTHPALGCLCGNPENIEDVKESELNQFSCSGEFGTSGPKYTADVQGMCCPDPLEERLFLNGWRIDTGLVHNLIVMNITPTEDIVDETLNFAVEVKDANGLNIAAGCDPQFTFSDISEGESGIIPIEDGEYKKSYSITANEGDTITKIWKQESGEPIILVSPMFVTLKTTSETIGDKTVEQTFQIM